jgi:hypothetical protein
LWVGLCRNWHNVIVFGLHIELHIQLCESMTKSYCLSWMLCDMWWNLWRNRHNVIVFGLISGFISNAVNLWRNLTVCHECNAIYDEIKKRNVNFVIDQRIYCSVYRVGRSCPARNPFTARNSQGLHNSTRTRGPPVRPVRPTGQTSVAVAGSATRHPTGQTVEGHQSDRWR